MDKIKIATIGVDDVAVGISGGAVIGALTQQIDKPKRTLSDGKFVGKKLVYFDSGLQVNLTGKEKIDSALTKARVLINRARHPSIPIYTDVVKIPKGSVIYNNSGYMILSPANSNVNILNNPRVDQRSLFVNKHRLHTHKAFTSRDIGIKTETVAEYLRRKLKKPSFKITQKEAEKVLTAASHKFIKPVVGSRSEGVYMSGDKLETGYDRYSGPGIKRRAGQPAIKTVLENPVNHIIQDRLEIKGNKEFRVHISESGIDDIAFQRWGRRAGVKTSKHINSVFLEKLYKAHKEYSKGMKNLIIGYDVAKTNKGWKVIEGNLESGFLTASHIRAKNLRFKKFVTGKGITGKAIGLGGLAVVGLTAVTQQLTKKAAKKKTDLPVNTIAAIGGIAASTGAYIKLRQPEYHHSLNVASLQRESKGKVTSFHYAPQSKTYKLLNKVIFGGSIKYQDPKILKEQQKGPYMLSKQHRPGRKKGIIIFGRGASGARGWDSDIGINMPHGHTLAKKYIEKHRFADEPFFKNVAVENLSLEKFLKAKGYTPQQFLAKSDNEWEGLFKQWHKKIPIFVKSNSSNLKGIYGDLDKIRYQALSEVEGVLKYVPTADKTTNYGVLRKTLQHPQTTEKGELIPQILIGRKIDLSKYKEYRVHILDNHILNASPRWGTGALEVWETNPNKIGKNSVEQIEKAFLGLRNKVHKMSPSYRNASHHARHRHYGADIFIDPQDKLSPKIIEINANPMTAGRPMIEISAKDKAKILENTKNLSKKIQNKTVRIAQKERNIISYKAEKAFYKSLTGRKEFRNVAMAKALVPGLGVAALTGAAIYGINKKRQK